MYSFIHLLIFFRHFHTYKDTETVSPFFSLDLGVGIGLTKGVDGMAGFICTPSVGVKLSHCTLQVGYNMQRNSEYGFGYTMGSIQMKLGYIF